MQSSHIALSLYLKLFRCSLTLEVNIPRHLDMFSPLERGTLGLVPVVPFSPPSKGDVVSKLCTCAVEDSTKGGKSNCSAVNASLAPASELWGGGSKWVRPLLRHVNHVYIQQNLDEL